MCGCGQTSTLNSTARTQGRGLDSQNGTQRRRRTAKEGIAASESANPSEERRITECRQRRGQQQREEVQDVLFGACDLGRLRIHGRCRGQLAAVTDMPLRSGLICAFLGQGRTGTERAATIRAEISWQRWHQSVSQHENHERYCREPLHDRNLLGAPIWGKLKDLRIP